MLDYPYMTFANIAASSEDGVGDLDGLNLADTTQQ